MRPKVFTIVDVFAETRYAGNPLAVFQDAADIPDAEMQQIAKETNFAETTFILGDEPQDGGYSVRIFTPVTEVPFAGHPTIGTATVIREELIGEPVEMVTLNLKVGPIPVRFETGDDGHDVGWMQPKEPTFSDPIDPSEILPLLTIHGSDLDERFPIQVVSTGFPFVIVPVKTLDAIRRAGTRTAEYLSWAKDKEAKNIFVFCPETYHSENHLNARMFADCYGVPEDPATGSANCCLAGYLVEHRYFGTDAIDVRVEQGYEIGRNSLLYLQAGRREGKIGILVGGKVFKIAQGQWL